MWDTLLHGTDLHDHKHPVTNDIGSRAQGGFEQSSERANEATPFVLIVDDQYVFSPDSHPAMLSLDAYRTYGAVKQKWALPGRNSAHWILNYFKFVFWFCCYTLLSYLTFGRILRHDLKYSRSVLILQSSRRNAGTETNDLAGRYLALGIHRFS